MLDKDIADNKAIGRHGAEAILVKTGGPAAVLTHCNTGSLATAGYGTALGKTITPRLYYNSYLAIFAKQSGGTTDGIIDWVISA